MAAPHMTIREPKDCPYYLISRSSLAVTAALKEEFASAGVGSVRPSYLGVLMSLWNEDGLHTAELGRRAGLEPSSMTGLLDRMERDGFVTRAADLTDRRAQRIHLTALGREVRGAVLGVVSKTLSRVLDGVSEADLARLKQTLRQVLANTDKTG